MRKKTIIPSVNNLLEQPLQNEMSEDEIMHDQVGQSEFENLDEDKIIQDDYSSVQDRSRSPRERNMGKRQGQQSNPENETFTRSTIPTRSIRPIYVSGRCSDTGKLICLIYMSIRESQYVSR